MKRDPGMLERIRALVMKINGEVRLLVVVSPIWIVLFEIMISSLRHLTDSFVA